MSWYKVIKTVKGHQYAYMQRSWRENGHVRTESRYIGAVSACADTGATGQSGTEKQETGLTGVEMPVAPSGGITPPHSVTGSTSPASLPSGFLCRFDLSRIGISTARLESGHEKARELAARLGVPPDRFPALVVASGGILGHRRARLRNAVVVSVPRGEKNRAAIRREVHRATGRALLDSLKAHNPERYCALAGAMDRSFRETNRLLFRFLSAQDRASRIVLSLQIYAFGYVSKQTAPRHLRDSPERLGIAGYGDAERRTSWEAETVSLLANAQGKGWTKVAEDQRRSTARAAGAERKAMQRYLETRTLFDRFTGKRRLMRKRLMQATEARQLCEEAERKTALLYSVLKPPTA